MKDRILPKTELASFLDRLLKRYRVVAPVDQGEYSLFRPLQRGEEVCLDYLKPARSAKEVFFPQNEDLFYFIEQTQKCVEPESIEKETVLFGVRPCDLKGIEAQDRLFLAGAFQDSYYQNRRKHTILIGLGCESPEASCFCHNFDIDPRGSTVADLFCVPIDNGFYYVSVQSKQGEALAGDLQEAGAEHAQALEETKRRPLKFSAERIPLEELPGALADRFDDPLWEEIAMRCLGCSTCTFVCPTCHCFDITDETHRGVGRRVRTWDSCAAPKFTLHASGHNPRTSNIQRMRQRILHKFSFFKDNQGVISCTGCGRCVAACPVNLDIREVLSELLATKT